MIRFSYIFIVVTLLLFQTYRHAMADDANAEPYRIQPGDVLEISVWKEESLLKEVLVRPDGGMSYPLVGNVQAAGQSVEALQKKLNKSQDN